MAADTTIAPQRPDPEVARVVLYLRAGCHLCEQARAVLARVREQTGQSWQEVDVDSSAELRERYGDLVPVVEVDGVRQGHLRIDADRVRRVLAAPAPEC